MGILSRAAAAPRKGFAGIGRRNAISFNHKMVIGAAGAITSQDTDSAVSAALGTAGLYTFTLPKPYRKLGLVSLNFIGPVPGAAAWVVSYTITTDSVNSAGTFVVQFFTASTGAAGNVPNPTTLVWTIEVFE